ncbi:hypothetical protein SAMN02982927_03264 [Sporolactobacillus nakayamae]|uniref:RsgI N-terminal anti-sigma domain-containing protein n=1 Tax=Sporolactobacillus nakayamae TaxID=269670 RepID=A0A1I2VX78_9BACL|nr:anti-sigma factor domain-containing protein [Sporolactobacillus nakayamae]SFG92917.1 hypothetical protein SAMN02982927_03264 [Sporolactobacillus nakayamae]
MSKKGRRAIILTNEGDFKSVRLRRTANLSIGQTVFSEHLAHQFYLLPRSFLTPIIALGVSVLCFIPLSNSTYAPSGPVAAYVYIDLKASIEASVDRNMHVISVQPLNNEAKQIISETSVFQNMTFSDLSSALLSKLGDERITDKRSLCLITTVLTDQISRKQRTEFTQGLITAFNSGAKQLLQANGSGVEWLRTSVERKRAAEMRGLSAGKYLLYLRANAYGKTLSLEDARRLSAEKMREVSESVSLPWNALLKESAGQMKSQIHSEQASFNGRQAQPLFRDPFQSVEPIQSRQDSSYHYWNSRVAGYA